MALEYFKNPAMLRWKVRNAAGSSLCQQDCCLTIDGTEGEGKVTVTCQTYPKEHIYENGTYDKGTDSISGKTSRGDRYTLGQGEGPTHRVNCGFGKKVDGKWCEVGSWTADDNLPLPEDH